MKIKDKEVIVIGILLLVGSISFGGGIVTGGAFAAFYSLLQIIPRLAQITETNRFIKLYQNMFVFGSLIFTIIYFNDFYIKLDKFSLIVISLMMGTFVGIFASALAEVLNVLPVLSKKMKFKNSIRYVIYSLMFGKMMGSLYYWITY